MTAIADVFSEVRRIFSNKHDTVWEFMGIPFNYKEKQKNSNFLFFKYNKEKAILRAF